MSEHTFHEDFCESDIHNQFELSYCSYLVLHRTLMQEMPAEWQHAFVALWDELHEAFPEGPGPFTVLLRGDRGRFVKDRLAAYRYPDPYAVKEARGKTV